MNFFTAIAVLALLLCSSNLVRAQATQFVLTAQPQDSLASTTMPAIVGEFRNASNVLVSTTAAATMSLVTNYSETRSGAQLALLAVDSAETAAVNTPGTNAIDGNIATWWGTNWSVPPVPLPPHFISIDIGSVSRLIGLTYRQRQGTNNGSFANYEVYVSSDGVIWGNSIKTGTFANVQTLQNVSLSAVFGRYLKLVELTAISGQPWGSASEITIQRTTTGLGVLTGTLIKNAVAGVATFNNIALTTSGTYVVQVTSLGIAGAQSVVFTIAENPPGTPGNVRATPEPY